MIFSPKTLEKYLRIADDRLGVHQYLAGYDFTLADIQLGHCLYRYYDVDIKRAGLRNLYAYYQKLRERRAFASTVMVSYDELRVSEG